jgi:hypothetical protein
MQKNKQNDGHGYNIYICYTYNIHIYIWDIIYIFEKIYLYDDTHMVCHIPRSCPMHINLPWYPHGETARVLWLCLGTHDAIPRHEPALEPGRHVQQFNIWICRIMYVIFVYILYTLCEQK